jgi:DNA repair photolyase
LPGITDRTRDLEDVARAASRAGACYFAINVLFLMPSAQKAFFPFLEVQFPHLVERYRRIYASSAYLRGEYPAKIELLASELRGKYNLTDRQHGHPAALMASPQMELFAEKRC